MKSAFITLASLLVGGIIVFVLMWFTEGRSVPLETNVKTDLQNLLGQAKLFKTLNGRVPRDQEEWDQYIVMRVGSLPVDPWGNTYIYHATSSDENNCSVKSLGQDNVSDRDDIVATMRP